MQSYTPEPRLMEDSVEDGPDPSSAWASVTIEELFRLDSRPTLVIDLTIKDESGLPSPQVVYQNPVFQAKYNLDGIVWKHSEPESLKFQEWACSTVNHSVATSPDRSYVYWDLFWTCLTLRDRWRVVTVTPPPLDDSHEPKNAAAASDGPGRASMDESVGPTTMGTPSHDWTTAAPPTILSPYIECLRSWDWSRTPLGPIEGWSSQLRLMTNLICTSPRPTAIFWGPRYKCPSPLCRLS